MALSPGMQWASLPQPERGVLTLEFETWGAFVDYVLAYVTNEPDFVWRGQRVTAWLLEPGLDRLLKGKGLVPEGVEWSKVLSQHLERFKLASRGRGGLDPRDFEVRMQLLAELPEEEQGLQRVTAAQREENNWWAVGQHYGLRTPLLDWSKSPFVALFFAYELLHPEADRGKERVVYGLHKRLVVQRSKKLREAHLKAGSADTVGVPVIDFVEPLYKDNPRLVSQGGLFTRAPDGVDVKHWVQTHFDGDEGDFWMQVLILPESERVQALKGLNRMNIHHQSLFPDLYGATAFVNFHLDVTDY